MTKHLPTIALLLLIVILYGIAGALDNDDSELNYLIHNLTHSNSH